jgi:hypothetical protein
MKNKIECGPWFIIEHEGREIGVMEKVSDKQEAIEECDMLNREFGCDGFHTESAIIKDICFYEVVSRDDFRERFKIWLNI